MIKIKSYIMIPNQKFSSLEELNKNPQEYYVEIDNFDKIQEIKPNLNLDYLDGAIIITYNNQTILNYKDWDLVDHLWAYFINLIEELEENNESKTKFPDQPIKIHLKKISTKQSAFFFNYP